MIVKRLPFAQCALTIAVLTFAPLPTYGGSSDPSYFQAKNLVMFSNPMTFVPGAANLTRTGDGISYRVYTSGLAPGAYTIWFVMFNRPENCAAGSGKCAAPDLADPAVEGSVVYGTGSIVGWDGVANFHGSVSEGAPPVGLQLNVPGGTTNGLKDSRKAEIHLIVRAHGPVSVSGNAVTQLNTFESCGSCMNVQMAIFEAVK